MLLQHYIGMVSVFLLYVFSWTGFLSSEHNLMTKLFLQMLWKQPGDTCSVSYRLLPYPCILDLALLGVIIRMSICKICKLKLEIIHI